MKIYDITQELFSSVVYPGDPVPVYERFQSIADGGHANVSKLSMCAHNGTHIDAPFHFIDGAKTIEQLDLNVCVGMADVVECTAECFTAADAAKIPAGCERLLIRGGAYPDLAGAEAIVARGVKLIGVEPQSVGGMKAPKAVHICLLSAGLVVLEGIRLADVPLGKHMLFAAPLKLAGLDGAPVRALLCDPE